MAAAATQVLQVPTESTGAFERLFEVNLFDVNHDEEDLDLHDEVASASMFEGIVARFIATPKKNRRSPWECQQMFWKSLPPARGE